MYFDKSQIISRGGACRGAGKGGKGRKRVKSGWVLISVVVGSTFPSIAAIPCCESRPLPSPCTDHSSLPCFQKWLPRRNFSLHVWRGKKKKRRLMFVFFCSPQLSIRHGLSNIYVTKVTPCRRLKFQNKSGV